jgi:hypothetical protein
MKTRKALLGMLLASVFVLAACSQATEVASEDATEAESSEELMEDDEQMANDEMVDDEMADDEMIEDDEEMAESEMIEEDMMDQQITFVIRFENASPEGGLTVLAPGAYELNDRPLSFFDAGEADRGLGLEALAEDGDPSVLAGSISEMMGGDEMAGFAVSVFNTPVGADAPGPAGPGAAYEFSVEAYPGQYLTLATMFVQSNDWFFAPGEEGLELFNAEGLPLSGDITDQFFLWNAGTEVDQTPGEGADQAPRQTGPNIGEIENGLVSLVEGFTNFQILVTITPQS